MLNVECSIEHRELRIERSLETRDRPFDELRASRACRGTLHEERALGLTVDAYIDNAASRMLKKSASGVLASLRGSTYRGKPLGIGITGGGGSVRQDQLKGRTAHTKCGTYLLASSLAAALLDGLFEHPELLRHQRHSARFQQSFMYKPSFSADC